jgi:hypothetical protein
MRKENRQFNSYFRKRSYWRTKAVHRRGERNKKAEKGYAR